MVIRTTGKDDGGRPIVTMMMVMIGIRGGADDDGGD